MNGLKKQYSQPGLCFKLIDFLGKGFITKDDFLKGISGIKHPFSKE